MHNLDIPRENNVTACERRLRLVHVPGSDEIGSEQLPIPLINTEDAHGASGNRWNDGASHLDASASGSGPQVSAQPHRAPAGPPLTTPLQHVKNWILGKPTGQEAGGAPPLPFAWRRDEMAVAVTDSRDQVHVFGLKPSGSERPGSWKHRAVLSHECQKQVAAVEWRPHVRSMLAVGGQQGVCVWTLGNGPLASAGVSATGGPAQGASMKFLRHPSGARCTALGFSPNGSLLAAASEDARGLVVWDVALGVGEVTGTVAFRLLKWSPDGAYLFAAGFDHHFYIFETDRWTCQRFDTTPGDSCLAASWAPTSRTLLLAQRVCSTLRTIHLLGDPPSLSTQAYDLPLPEVWTGNRLEDPTVAPPSRVLDMALDPSGNRLAVAIGGSHPAAGLLALYSITGAGTPGTMVHANFIGYVRPPASRGAGSLAGSKLELAAAAGQGAVLSVRLSAGQLYSVPLYL